MEPSTSFQERLERYAQDAPSGMSRYQIERFVIGKLPPVGRYHQCCLEIRRRLEALRNSELQEADREAIGQELRTFAELAEAWLPATRGLSHEQLQPVYWDQKFAFELGIRLLTGQPYEDVARNIMLLDPQSASRRLLVMVLEGQLETAVIQAKAMLDGQFAQPSAIGKDEEDGSAQCPVKTA